MNFPHNTNLTVRAQELRKNMTKEERKLWYDYLKNLPYVVKRQEVIEKYIVDFYFPKQKLVVELDGTQHYEAEGKRSDNERDEFLAKKGISVVRFSNRDVNRNFFGVCEEISRKIGFIK